MEDGDGDGDGDVNVEEPEMYVCNPVKNKDGVKYYTSYTLKGSKVPEPLNRRYRDFDALRKKLVERWPGVFIPNIPHKKKVANKSQRIITMRVEMINRFLKKLCKLDYLVNSEEMELFLQNSSSVTKTLEGVKVEPYDELLKKYSSAFTDYDENFDTQAGKEDQEKFGKKLIDIHQKIKNFRAIVANAKERYKDDQENYLNVINMLSLYEKESLNSFVNNDENKLIFFNMKNVDLYKHVSNTQEQVINPYERLYDAITEDYLDIEAMSESLETLKNLQETYNKISRNYNSINTQINELQSKAKSKKLTKLMNEKESMEKDVNDLGQVIKIATFNMQNTINNFKTISLDNYYAELSRLNEDTEKNATIFDNLWEAVVKDKNISEFN
jgi:hypothetical protein